MEIEHRYIGIMTRSERAAIFAEVFENEAQLMRLNEAVRGALGDWQWREDPYALESWPDSKEAYAEATAYHRMQKSAAIAERYEVGESIDGVDGARLPTINRVRLIERVPGYVDILRSVMPDGTDLVLKRMESFGMSVGEKEILVAYHLRELVHGYTQLLSLHFMMVLDWWMAPSPEPTQFVVCESLDQTLWWRIRRAYFPERPHSYQALTLNQLRAIVFQVLSALELAWLTHRFVHGDLHVGNIMMKQCADESVLYDRAWLYRRYNDPDYWYVLPIEAHGNQIVKLIDFDQSSLSIPLSRRGDRPLDGVRHSHPGRAAPAKKAWWNDDRSPLSDPSFFLRSLGSHGEMSWKEWEKEDASAVRRLRLLIENAFSNTRQQSASQLLNDAFFAPLRHRFTEQETRALDLVKLTARHVVVSFATSFYELNARGPPDVVAPIEPTPGPTDGGMRFVGDAAGGTLCIVCGMEARAYTAIGESHLCGRTCYEFHYCFARRTAVQ